MLGGLTTALESFSDRYKCVVTYQGKDLKKDPKNQVSQIQTTVYLNYNSSGYDTEHDALDVKLEQQAEGALLENKKISLVTFQECLRSGHDCYLEGFTRSLFPPSTTRITLRGFQRGSKPDTRSISFRNLDPSQIASGNGNCWPEQSPELRSADKDVN